METENIDFSKLDDVFFLYKREKLLTNGFTEYDTVYQFDKNTYICFNYAPNQFLMVVQICEDDKLYARQTFYSELPIHTEEELISDLCRVGVDIKRLSNLPSRYQDKYRRKSLINYTGDYAWTPKNKRREI